jgi:hypothetical protein
MEQVVAEASPVALPVMLAGLAAAAGIIGLLIWWFLRRRASASIPARLRRAGDDMLTRVLIPNADTGQIHLDYAVLTRKGIVIVDVRDIAGHVFGSETMQDWTVLGRNQRFTFSNPLPPLYDRVAAVRRLLPDIPVRGCVAFTARAEFSKGFPPNAVMFDALLGELSAARNSPDGPPAELLQASWKKLREEAVAAQIGRLLDP